MIVSTDDNRISNIAKKLAAMLYIQDQKII